MAFLVGGRIPVGVECKWKSECPMGTNFTCRHLGKEHQVPYSCGAARAYELVERYQKPIEK